MFIERIFTQMASSRRKRRASLDLFGLSERQLQDLGLSIDLIAPKRR